MVALLYHAHQGADRLRGSRRIHGVPFPEAVIKFATGASMFFLRWRVCVPRVQQSTQGVCRAAGLPGLPGFGRTNESSVEFSPGARGAPCYS